MLRGVSGGERKRVTAGEIEFGMKYVTFMGEISTGLNSAATYNIIDMQRSVAKKFRKAVVIALLQPTRKVFALFDDVIIMNEGEVMYHGPREQVVGYFENLGFVCPSERDIVDYLLDLGTKQQRKYKVVSPQNRQRIFLVVDYEPLKNKTVVAIDPNMSDLLYCVDGDTKNQTRFRYTQDTRCKETKAKKYRDYVQGRKQEVIDGKHIDEWEAELSAYNKKTTDFECFRAYVEKKNEVNRRLGRVYNEYVFQKLKLGGYMRRQITGAQLLKRFEELIGSGADTIQ